MTFTFFSILTVITFIDINICSILSVAIFIFVTIIFVNIFIIIIIILILLTVTYPDVALAL